MTIELSNITFTEQDDIVPPSGVEPIFNTGIPNTLAGNDILTATWATISDGIIIDPSKYSLGAILGFYNTGTLNTADGNDQIKGIIQNPTLQGYFGAALYNERGTIDTGDGDDIIIGSHNENVDPQYVNGYGIYNIGIIDTGDGNDIITGITKGGGGFATYGGSIITGNGNDTITGIASSTSNFGGSGLANDYGNIDTGSGNDIITGTGMAGLQNYSTITTSSGNDIITGTGTSDRGILNASSSFSKIGNINTGDGDDIITGMSTDNYSIDNLSLSIIDTGDGNDVITAIGGLGIRNQGTINTGNGNDSLIANEGFISNNTTGNVFLGNGKDYLKSFGKGIFNGGKGQDTLELTPGSYTVGISETTVNFIKGSTIMETSDFEILIAGNTTYRIRRLTEGQTIFVA
jgi:hypothetical protein